MYQKCRSVVLFLFGVINLKQPQVITIISWSREEQKGTASMGSVLRGRTGVKDLDIDTMAGLMLKN